MINGSKQFITNSGSDITSCVTVTARTGVRADGKPEISALHRARRARPGFVAEPAYDKLGWHASDTHPLTLDRRPRRPGGTARRREGRGYAQFLATLDDGRIAIAALALGCIRPAATWPATTRWNGTSFGVPIGRKQGVAFQIADLDAMAHTATCSSTRRPR